MRKVIVVDTSILCVYLEVPGKSTCGSDDDRWDYNRVNEKIKSEKAEGATLVLPLATIIETGNHIAQLKPSRRDIAEKLAEIMHMSADEREPWAAFSDQAELWTPDRLRSLAEEWPDLAIAGLSLGDTTIKDVANNYAQGSYQVEILTGDRQLRSFQPVGPREVPRRRRSRRS